MLSCLYLLSSLHFSLFGWSWDGTQGLALKGLMKPQPAPLFIEDTPGYLGTVLDSAVSEKRWGGTLSSGEGLCKWPACEDCSGNCLLGQQRSGQ